MWILELARFVQVVVERLARYLVLQTKFFKQLDLVVCEVANWNTAFEHSIRCDVRILDQMSSDRVLNSLAYFWRAAFLILKQKLKRY